MLVFDMSIETVHRIAQLAAIVGAVIIAISMAVTYWSSSIIKKHSQIEIDEAHARTNELTTALEEEQAARALIESGLSSRHLTSDQQATLISRLKGSDFTVKISTYSDTETIAYAREIASALSAAGITVEQGNQVMAAAGSPHRGVFIEEHSPDVLKLAFQEAGIEVTLLPSRRNDLIGTGQGAPVVLIGLKPEAF